MPQSGKSSTTVHELLRHYKERCSAERKRPRTSSESLPALLPVSFAQAKDWLLQQQRAQSEALESGAVNEEAREIAVDLSDTLSQRPAATAELLEQPAHIASPVVPPPAMSLGPVPVTTEEREKERAVERARRKAEAPRTSSLQKGKGGKKKKVLSPEMAERRMREFTRMQELGVTPLQVRSKS